MKKLLLVGMAFCLFGMLLRADDPPSSAAAVLEKLGAKVQRDAKKRVVAIDLANNKNITNADLAVLKDLKDVTSLTLFYTKIGDEGVAHFKDLKTLTDLRMSGTPITDAGLVHIKGLPLHKLYLGNTTISDKGLAHIGSLTDLTYLSLPGSRITDEGMKHVTALVKLQTLSVEGCPITDAGLEAVKGLTQLQVLKIGSSKITDAGLKHLKALSDMRELWIDSTPVTDKGILENLGGMDRLTTLRAMNCRISGASLKNFPLLQSLFLSGSTVSDADLDHLKQLTKLSYLTLQNSKVTAAGVEELRKSLPKTKIVH